MKIGIYVEAAKGQLRGIGYHIQQLVYGLSRYDSSNEYFLYYQGEVKKRSENTYDCCPNQANFRLRPVMYPQSWVEKHPTLWWKYVMPWAVRRDRLDVFHSPNYFLPALSRGKRIVTIHDLAFFKMELYPNGITAMLRQWTRKALQSADRVIALSQNTRNDIETLQIDPAKIRVIYGGGHIMPEESIPYERLQDMRMAFNLPEKYILFTGILHPRKNVPFLVHAYARLKRTASIPHGLVLAGFKGPATEEIEGLVQQLGLGSEVVLTGYVDDWQLALLYKHADVFVLPTLYEGFTLVTLEAMSYGIPIVATDCSSIREGVGEAATLIPCDDIDAMAKAIHALIVNETLRQERILLGKQQAKKFSWDRCARETLAVYQELGEELVGMQ
jgi:glycosyltransferase involved in cell wall biosynthesis